MTQLASLKAASDISDLASLLNFKAKSLAFVAYGQNPSNKYTQFQIPKKSGGFRTIDAPTKGLKLVQRRIANLLQNCLDEIDAANGWADPPGGIRDRISHGFKRRRSIVTNASQHLSRRFVFNVDLKDFFPSINFGRVRGILSKDARFKLHPDVAQVIAHIACLSKQLPQGSPCSPVLSNIVARVLDVRLTKLAKKYGCTYTRYADDLTFSTSKATFPESIAIRTPDGLWEPGRSLAKQIESTGFTVNPSKSRMSFETSRQAVTGLVVNRKVNVPSDVRRASRAMVHSLVTTGSFHTLEQNSLGSVRVPGSIESLRGLLGFINSIDFHNHSLNPLDPHRDLQTKEQAFRKFLLYTQIFAGSLPLLICEGKTDNVYLVHAIRQRAKHFPKLAFVSPAGDPELLVKRFRYSGTSTQRLLGLNGGAADIGRFAQTYHKESKKFSGTSSHPVILVTDNDSGGKTVFNMVQQYTSSKKILGTEPFVHLFGNLYLCPTPLKGKPESAIEDCFDDAALKHPFDGKTFSPRENFDKSKHFGKAVFAHKVVAQNASSINFSGFDELLENISKAIDHFASITVP